MQNDSCIGEAEEVLRCLQPHKHLKKLSVEKYPGTSFPRWVDTLSNLTEIVLINCKNCEHLPQLGKLPFLRIVYMQGMHAVIKIGSEFYNTGSKTSFQSLHELTVIDFPNLEFWWSTNAEEQFPVLFKLAVRNCPGLKNMPYIPRLQRVELRSCNEIILRSAANLTSLTFLSVEDFKEELLFLGSLLENNSHLVSLTISSCPKLCSTSLKIGSLVALKSLTIRWCPELHSLPQELQKLSALESLEISECQLLTALPEAIQNLRVLKSLYIENCYKSLPTTLLYLSALEHLSIMYCPNLASLLYDLTHLSKLRSLCIHSCPRLAFLPESLQHVTSLLTLEIHGYPALKYLPEWIYNLVFLRSLVISDCQNMKSLPEGLKRLSNLRHLSIRECPDLEERCRKSIGQDWPNIAHIPQKYVGCPKLKQQDFACSSTN